MNQKFTHTPIRQRRTTRGSTPQNPERKEATGVNPWSFTKYIFHDYVYDLMRKLLVVAGAAYIMLFCAEAILPGMVIEVFNINILLLFIIIDIGYLIWFPEKNSNIQKDFSAKQWISRAVYRVVIPVMIITLIIVQYKIPIITSLIYMVFAIIIGRLLYKMV
ncbi:MAG: hypothetical protein U9M90_03080 [Patescibacteria group bacterium]|nr:hypothetical protein [Patescibacteria group bacterium]